LSQVTSEKGKKPLIYVIACARKEDEVEGKATRRGKKKERGKITEDNPIYKVGGKGRKGEGKKRRAVLSTFLNGMSGGHHLEVSKG